MGLSLSINSADLRRMNDALATLSKGAFPELRQEFLPELGQAMKEAVDAAIAGSVNDSNGHVRGWQVIRYGSGGGYAAISPDADIMVARGRNSYSAARITKAINNGHAGRLPSGRDPYYRPRIKLGRAAARKFYSTAFSRIENHADIFAKQIGYRLRQKFMEAMR